MIVALAFILFPFMQSCVDIDDDIASANDTVNAYNTALATVITASEVPGAAVLEKDNGELAYVVNPEMLTLADANKEGQRIFYRYVGAESPNGQANSKGPYINITEIVMKILTKPIDFLREDEEDVYGQDGIYVASYSLGEKYLTLQFQVMASNKNIAHRISLVAKEDAAPDAEGYLTVELRHNAEGDTPESITSPGYVSFLLTDAPGYKEGTLKGYKMKYQSINQREETVTINKNAENKSISLLQWENTYNTKIK